MEGSQARVHQLVLAILLSPRRRRSKIQAQRPPFPCWQLIGFLIRSSLPYIFQGEVPSGGCCSCLAPPVTGSKWFTPPGARSKPSSPGALHQYRGGLLVSTCLTPVYPSVHSELRQGHEGAVWWMPWSLQGTWATGRGRQAGGCKGF